MEDLGWRGRHAHLDIVLGTQLQEPLQSCRRMLRPLPFIAMGKQQGQATKPAPFVLATGQELVNHYLGAVGKVTELGLPNDQCVRRGG